MHASSAPTRSASSRLCARARLNQPGSLANQVREFLGWGHGGRPEMVFLGFGKYVRADRIYAVEPLRRRRARLRRPHPGLGRGHPEPLIASRTERAILAEMGTIPALGLVLRRRTRTSSRRRVRPVCSGACASTRDRSGTAISATSGSARLSRRSAPRSASSRSRTRSTRSRTRRRSWGCSASRR